MLKLSEIIKNQAIFIVGTTGHVMHGKSTLVQRLTGQRTQRHQSEIKENKSINLGYANCKIWMTENGLIATGSDVLNAGQLLCHVSFADCPGHEDYMSAMINGTSVMDYAFVVIAGNEPVTPPRTQTLEHIKALDCGGITGRTYILNKLDLLKEAKARECYQNLATYLGQSSQSPTIIPFSCVSGISGISGVSGVSGISDSSASNITYIINDLINNEALNRDKFLAKTTGAVRMNIVRSYNINKPGSKLKNMQGAVIGGTLTRGILSVGDYIEIRPGVICMHAGVKHIRPLYSVVTDLKSEKTSMQIAVPGGLIGVGLTLFAGLSGANRLAGQVMGHPGTLPDMYDILFGAYEMLSNAEFSVNQQVQLVANGVMIVSASIKMKKEKKEKAKEVGTGRIEFLAQSPIVIDKGARIAVMVNNKLIAHFDFIDGDLSIPILSDPTEIDTVQKFIPKTYKIVDDLPKSQTLLPDYETMSRQITYRTTKTQKTAMYIPQIKPINKSSYTRSVDIIDCIINICYTR
jgi:translation initiation factor 2 subunit 3